MKPLLVLLVVFLLALVAHKLLKGAYNVLFAARLALAVMLLFTAMGHFVFTKGMLLMVPEFISFKKEIVYVTGVVEIAAAIGLFVPGLRELTGWLLLLFFLLLLPANVHAAATHLDYQKATFTGDGLSYLWFRVPLQFLFMAWTYLCCIRF